MKQYYCRTIEPQYVKEMNNTQIREAIAMFKQVLKEHPEDFKISGEDPIKQNAYTSSSFIPGVYFPNTAIRLVQEKHYDVIAVGLEQKNNRYCIILRISNDNPSNLTPSQWQRLQEVCPQFLFLPMDEILYSDAERKLTNDLHGYIKECNAIAAAIGTLKRVYKKDGTSFARLEANYPEAKIYISRNFEGFITQVEISGKWAENDYIRIDLHIPSEMKHTDLTADELGYYLELRRRESAQRIGYYAKQLRASHQAFLKCQKACQKVRDVLDSVPETKDGPYKTALFYGLVNYINNAI